MSLAVWAEDNDGEIVEWPDKLRVSTLEVTINAEECSSGSSEVVLDDATADFYVRGLKPMYFVESEATGDDRFGIIGPFWTERRAVRRGNERTGSRREWGITVRDLNSLLTYRIQKGTDAERPDETDVERMEWVIGTAEIIGGHGDHGFTIEETEFLFTDAPVDMGETSYVGVEGGSVINDCMQQSGANAYLYNAPNDYSPIRVGIWYGRTERSDFASLHKISNVLDDISPEYFDNFEGVTPQYETGYVFPPSLDAVLDRDPSRQITGAMLQWDGGNTYGSSPIITPTLTRRDMSFSGELVKNETQATARVQRYLTDLAEEDDAIECAVVVPAWLVHAFEAGHRVQFKNSYMPGYEDDYVWMRVARVTIRQIVGEDGEALGRYELGLDLRAETPPGPPLPPPVGPFVCEGGAYDATETGDYARNGSQITLSHGLIFYSRPGLGPPTVPTPGYHGTWFFPVFDGTADFNCDAISQERLLVVGPGTMTIHTTNQKRGGATLAATFTAEVWKKVDGVGVPDVLLDTVIGTPGVDLEIDIPNDDATDCIHYVEVYGNSGSMGVNGFSWVLGS